MRLSSVVIYVKSSHNILIGGEVIILHFSSKCVIKREVIKLHIVVEKRLLYTIKPQHVGLSNHTHSTIRWRCDQSSVMLHKNPVIPPGHHQQQQHHHQHHRNGNHQPPPTRFRSFLFPTKLPVSLSDTLVRKASSLGWPMLRSVTAPTRLRSRYMWCGSGSDWALGTEEYVFISGTADVLWSSSSCLTSSMGGLDGCLTTSTTAFFDSSTCRALAAAAVLLSTSLI